MTTKRGGLITLPSSKRPKNTKPFVLRSNDYLESFSPEKTSIIVSESTSPNQKKRDYLNLVPSNSLANIKSTDGAAFQARFGLPHVTLVFFDGQGQHIHTIQGVIPANEIKSEITRVFA